ncbi:MAG TPA: hydantoinase B/oxoprolinase family protein, partial [Chloroflexota bacterium]|nr:hydantoinase B/oxoprolinase family protein [Chloroflexota bacterium]
MALETGVSAPTAKLDPITFEVVRNALDSIADQMAITLMRSAYSAIVRDSVDYSTAFCDRQGRMLAQGLTTPLHLGSFPDAMRHLAEQYRDRMQPGDIFTLNDPYGAGGMHLPDIYVIKPVFFEGKVEGFAATLAHHTDVGGLTPGSNSIHSTEIFQEGLRIPLLKLYERGEPNDTLFRIIEKNVRVPLKVLGDLRAQVAACHVGEKSFLPLLTKHGSANLHRYLDELLDYAEQQMRAAIAAIPDGRYRFTDHIDGLGENAEPIVIQVELTIQGAEILVDWTGSSPQVKVGINCPIPFTRSATYVALRSAIAPDLPNSEGYMRPIVVSAPLGSIVNPTLPAACGARGITGFRMIDAVLGALAQVIPDRVPAAGEGGSSLLSIGGYQAGTPFLHVETILGSWGGRPDQDGAEGISNPGANQSNQPIEIIEAELPLRARQYALQPDSGGAGRFRGGLGLVREFELLADEASLTMRSDRRTHRPYGLFGGQPGSPSTNILNPGPDQRILPTLPMESVALRKGDVFRHVLAGGGGYGDPLERDPD